jgi:DhnA family fructose-bisphosphate aldolase class Ia
MNSNLPIGKSRRLSRLLDKKSGRTVIVPIDDSLIFGPFNGLENLSVKIKQIAEAKPNGILAYQGVFKGFAESLRDIGGIINLTASSVRSIHTRKVLIGDVNNLLLLDPEAVAVHVNVTSTYESEMIKNLGQISMQCDSLGIPLMAIMYPRKELEGGDENYDNLKNENPKQYTDLVCHCVRIAADLGADIIKTKYTGSIKSFNQVIKACWPIPVVVAGGPLIDSKQMIKNAYEAVEGGATGISFGRNVFNRKDSRKFILALKEIVHNHLTPNKVLNMYEL